MATYFHNRRFIAALILFALGIGVNVPLEREARAAMDPDTLTVTRDGAWGLLGGTLAGLVALPLGGSVREIFLGSSVGLYLGIVVGIYAITHRDELASQISSLEDRGGDMGRVPGQVTYALPGQAPSMFNQLPPATASISLAVYRF
jgi:hypothetical protein